MELREKTYDFLAVYDYANFLRGGRLNRELLE